MVDADRRRPLEDFGRKGAADKRWLPAEAGRNDVDDDSRANDEPRRDLAGAHAELDEAPGMWRKLDCDPPRLDVRIGRLEPAIYLTFSEILVRYAVSG